MKATKNQWIILGIVILVGLAANRQKIASDAQDDALEAHLKATYERADAIKRRN